MRRYLTVVLVTALSMLATAGVATARRLAPFGTFGVVVNDALTTSSPSVLDAQMGLMARSGVESIRVTFDWSSIEPAANTYDFSGTDELMREAALHGLRVMPIILNTPQWASSQPNGAYLYYLPAKLTTFSSFMTHVVDRYGAHGSFWADNPGLTLDPIEDWQIWNEPAGTKYDWRSLPWPQTYLELLKAAYPAVHHADSRAKIVSGALVGLNTTNLTPWAEAATLYRIGWKRYFDILAVNAYTGSPSVTASVDRSFEIVSLVRAVMQRYHDTAKPVWDTEVTWTAALGKIPPADYINIETTPKGQAERMSGFFTRVALQHPAGLQRVFWYAWYSSYVPVSPFGDPLSFNYSGLVRWNEVTGEPFTPEPALAAYASITTKLEGCAKTSVATRCR